MMNFNGGGGSNLNSLNSFAFVGYLLCEGVIINVSMPQANRFEEQNQNHINIHRRNYQTS